MLKSHEKFHSENGKRLVLVAADDPATQEYFRELLEAEYILLFSADEHETRKLIRENGDILSLIVLHLTQPARVSLDLLSMIQIEPELQHIPVMVVDEDRDIEIEALEQGAMAVIVLPYPMKEVVQARIRRTIELAEDRAIISSTERDPLTSLYNREFFYRYAEQYDQHHKNTEMDAIVIDVNNFRTINERFGSAYGDAVLRRIGKRVRDMVKDSGGIVCRREADTFQVYCPHGKNYQSILDNASIGLAGDESINDRVRLRMGVYSKVDKSLDIERRFDRASMAADSVRSSFTKNIGMYDSMLHERELEDARMVEEFHQAIRERQFIVYYQPKYDVRGEVPMLTSAEALVRWMHPKKGLIAPARFIPLFEENGLIQPLDHYIWEEVARQQREWKQRLGFTVPISVNVSRINMYDPNMVNFLLELLKRYDLKQSDLYLEITESVYTEDSEQIIHRVELLRDLGFRIEMDDFGTGYSSLNMISTLPFDVMKLDMEFIRTTFRGQKNTRMMEIMLDIAEYLDVPVVAEGVETEEQMRTLQKMGCDVIQGYYFSRPIPPEEFEIFLIRRRALGGIISVHGSAGRHKTYAQNQEDPSCDMQMSEFARTLFRGFNRIYEVDPVTENYTEYRLSEDGFTLRVEKEDVRFFDYTKRNLVHYMHPEDLKQFLEMFSKARLVSVLSKKKSFSSVFRLMFGEKPSYVCIQASAEDTREGRRIIVGTGSVEVRIHQDYGNETVQTIGRDALTGTKNMTVYIQMEREINEEIEQGTSEPFALAVIDLDGYREVSMTIGKKEADKQVMKVSSIVCDVFDHSPVCRVGDDEFIAILKRRDYENRNQLIRMLDGFREKCAADGEAIFSYGMADFDPEKDRRLSNVYERANEAMYRQRETSE